MISPWRGRRWFLHNVIYLFLTNFHFCCQFTQLDIYKIPVFQNRERREYHIVEESMAVFSITCNIQYWIHHIIWLTICSWSRTQTTLLCPSPSSLAVAFFLSVRMFIFQLINPLLWWFLWFILSLLSPVIYSALLSFVLRPEIKHVWITKHGLS